MDQEARSVSWRNPGRVVQIGVEVPGMQKVIGERLFLETAAVERRLKLPPHLRLYLIWPAVARFLRYERTDRVPFRNVHGDKPADIAIAVVAAEQTYGVAPKLRLRDRR